MAGFRGFSDLKGAARRRPRQESGGFLGPKSQVGKGFAAIRNSPNSQKSVCRLGVSEFPKIRKSGKRRKKCATDAGQSPERIGEDGGIPAAKVGFLR